MRWAYQKFTDPPPICHTRRTLHARLARDRRLAPPPFWSPLTAALSGSRGRGCHGRDGRARRYADRSRQVTVFSTPSAGPPRPDSGGVSADFIDEGPGRRAGQTRHWSGRAALLPDPGRASGRPATSPHRGTATVVRRARALRVRPFRLGPAELADRTFCRGRSSLRFGVGP